jgi:hypothetical protein
MNKWGRNSQGGMNMPTTILDGEMLDQAYARRFREEAAIDTKVIASLQTAYCVTVRTSRGAETLNVLAFTSCDAIVRALDILFDGEQPMPADGMAISACPMLKRAA